MSAMWYQGGVGVIEREGWKGIWSPRDVDGVVKGGDVASRGAETGHGRLWPLLRARVLSPSLLTAPAVWLEQKPLSSLGSRFSLCKENRLNLKSLLQSVTLGVWVSECLGPRGTGARTCVEGRPLFHQKPCPGHSSSWLLYWHHGTPNHQCVFVLSPVGISETRNMATGVYSFTNRSSLFKG